MPRSKTPTINLEEAKARFGEWRQNRSGKGRIPAELWSAAVAVAQKGGLNRTARELHVAWDDLKRRMAVTEEIPRQAGSPASGFVSGNVEPGAVGAGVLIQITP